MASLDSVANLQSFCRLAIEVMLKKLHLNSFSAVLAYFFLIITELYFEIYDTQKKMKKKVLFLDLFF